MLGGAVIGGASAGAMTVGCSGEDDVDVGELRLATGPAGAVYRRIGGGLAGLIADRFPDATVTTVPSRASTDNIRMLSRGDADLGLSSLDAVIGPDGRPPDGIAALCRLYDSYLHLVVLRDTPVWSVADLDGMRVSYGARNSGTEFTTHRLVDLAGVRVDAVRLDQAESAEALDSGDIHAAFSLTGIPTPAISELAAEREIRFVAMEEQAGALADAFPGPYIPATIPATVYEGVRATPTVAVPNVLLARSDLDDDVVRAVTETVFTRAGELTTDRPDAPAVPQAWQINVRTGISTGSIPLHPGAREWFRAQKR
ncbi:TAXI family TRAP transporter solute-binding subunit [Phytoactinopolyspora halotolerans]|uniref:TAXI family TRAP transporter solute-binding subunit n=1 Tax=Phytoactinopolyspora halotolerans TaxID=1981512 RepID=A0A6L9SI38_9ACTN|nr:TAXI family TRAP transporter solute-binding subunit [Phytoactinopolyspora halotolerans]